MYMCEEKINIPKHSLYQTVKELFMGDTSWDILRNTSNRIKNLERCMFCKETNKKLYGNCKYPSLQDTVRDFEEIIIKGNGDGDKKVGIVLIDRDLTSRGPLNNLITKGGDDRLLFFMYYFTKLIEEGLGSDNKYISYGKFEQDNKLSFYLRKDEGSEKNRDEINSILNIATRLKSSINEYNYMVASSYPDISKNIAQVYDADFQDVYNKSRRLPGESVKFTASPSILTRLIYPLYGENPSYGFREVLQNSIDACKKPNESSIDIEVYIQKENNKYKLFILDYGKGMNAEEIVDNFLKIGSSPKSGEDGGGSIGKFGIGILAIFLMGDEFDITTRAEGELPITTKTSKKITKDDVINGERIELKFCDQQDLENQDITELFNEKTLGILKGEKSFTLIEIDLNIPTPSKNKIDEYVNKYTRKMVISAAKKLECQENDLEKTLGELLKDNNKLKELLKDNNELEGYIIKDLIEKALRFTEGGISGDTPDKSGEENFLDEYIIKLQGSVEINSLKPTLATLDKHKEEYYVIFETLKANKWYYGKDLDGLKFSITVDKESITVDKEPGNSLNLVKYESGCKEEEPQHIGCSDKTPLCIKTIKYNIDGNSEIPSYFLGGPIRNKGRSLSKNILINNYLIPTRYEFNTECSLYPAFIHDPIFSINDIPEFEMVSLARDKAFLDIKINDKHTLEDIHLEKVIYDHLSPLDNQTIEEEKLLIKLPTVHVTNGEVTAKKFKTRNNILQDHYFVFYHIKGGEEIEESDLLEIINQKLPGKSSYSIELVKTDFIQKNHNPFIWIAENIIASKSENISINNIYIRKSSHFEDKVKAVTNVLQHIINSGDNEFNLKNIPCKIGDKSLGRLRTNIDIYEDSRIYGSGIPGSIKNGYPADIVAESISLDNPNLEEIDKSNLEELDKSNLEELDNTNLEGAIVIKNWLPIQNQSPPLYPITEKTPIVKKEEYTPSPNCPITRYIFEKGIWCSKLSNLLDNIKITIKQKSMGEERNDEQ